MKYDKLDQSYREFINKFPKLKYKLVHKQPERDESSIQKDRRHLWIQIVAPIMVAAVGVVSIYMISGKKPSDSRTYGKQAETATGTQPAISAAALPAAGQKKRQTQQKAALPKPEPDSASPSKDAAAVLPHRGETEIRGDAKDIAAVAKGRDADPAGVKLVSTVVCNGVQDRQPLVEQHDFTVGDLRRAYVWMEIRSDTQPFIVKHIYYLNGRKYTEVPLEIKYPRMRSWSYLTIDKPSQIGDWRVDIVREDSLLKTVEFQVGASRGE